ncbi:HNH endonuclease [Pseudoalteromonas phage pYD6-A]|uniref:HNH nuclease domain-containing protein n=1 Tax=Pseudoalteromonas phage pYD6-A TaxID=754052 RepID=M4SNH5_9CAUD|nr:HNH endonuclease [Pseudoalteromonas phage pYD6-A]AGH57588.1 hypothetical protein PYDG_00057 [Pseudoalteromonas phage pYD6-A]
MNIREFTPLPDYPNYFIAHSPARIIRYKEGKYLISIQTPNSEKDPYWTTTLKDTHGKFVKRSVHRLLAQTFIPNPEAKAHVNHIDGDKSNNDLSNLEWATPKENSQHAVDLGLYPDTSKEVFQYLLDGTFVAKYASDREASKSTGIPYQNISKATLGKRLHAGYFQWSREGLETVLPVERKYPKEYVFQGRVYSTFKSLAEELGYAHPDKISISKFRKKDREAIQTIYYP